MAVQIRRSSLQKLTHESLEIRLRAFENINEKFRRAIKYKQPIEFKASELCKQLIRWFGFQPIPKPRDILDLLLELLNSEYGESVLNKIGADRLKIEIGKIQSLMESESPVGPCLEKLQKRIYEHQNKKGMEKLIKTTESMTISTDLSGIGAGDAPSRSVSAKEEDSKVCEKTHKYLSTCTIDDFEVPWEKPIPVDYSVLQSYVDTFTDSNSSKSLLDETLCHLTVTLTDYPIEYFLQPPHLFCYLLELLERAGEPHVPEVELVAESLNYYLVTMEDNLRLKYISLGFIPISCDPEVEPKTQLKLPKALEILVNVVLSKMDGLSRKIDKNFFALLQVIHKVLDVYKEMKYSFTLEQLQLLSNIAKSFQDILDEHNNIILDRVKYLVLMNLLSTMINQNATRGVTEEELDLLKPLICDYAYQKSFPNHFDNLKKLFIETNPKYALEFEKVKTIEHSLSISLNLLKAEGKITFLDLIHSGSSICQALNRLESLKLLELLLKAIMQTTPYSSTNPELKTKSIAILNDLMQLQNVPLKMFVYNKFLLSIKKHLACMMNTDQYIAGVPNSQLLEAGILGLPFSKDLMKLIIMDGLDSEVEEIRAASETILLLLMKSQHLLKNYWFQFFDFVLPYLPLLICYNKNKNMTALLLEVLNPDGDSVHFQAKLSGNIVFLYHEDSAIRNEALTRIIYMIQSMPNSAEYVPELREIQDTIPSNIFSQQTQKRLDLIFNSNDEFADYSTMSSLLEILQAQDIEPLIRKSTLLQLNVLCHNTKLLEGFCRDSAYFLILQMMENAMKKNSFRDYKDAIIPALGILTKSLIFDERLRHELHNVPNIYILLLRALFLFINDAQVRQDASTSLFLLIFTNHLYVDHEKKIVQIPQLAKDIKLPLRCETQGRMKGSKISDEPDVSMLFGSEETLQIYLRHHVAACFSTNYYKIKRSYLEKQLVLDVTSSYLLTQTDCAILKATMTSTNLKLFMHGIQNATDHASLVNACYLMQLQINLDKDMSDEYIIEIYKVLSKFIQLPPGNQSDYDLYSDLLTLFRTCIRMEYVPFIHGLTKSLLLDFNHSLITLLKDISLPLSFYHRLCKTFKELLKSDHAFGRTPTNGSSPSVFFHNLFELIFELAKKFFDRRDVDRSRCLLNVLRVLVEKFLHMTDKNLISYVVGSIKLSIALKNRSQTGANWQRCCIVVALSLYAQITDPKEAAKINNKSLKYIAGLCSHSDTQVRSVAWTFLLNIANNMEHIKDGITQYLADLSFFPGGFTSTCLSVFLDGSELILCRQVAGVIFAFLFTKALKFEETLEMILHHDFFHIMDGFVSTIYLEPLLPLDFDFQATKVLTPVDLIIVSCQILCHLVEMNPDFVSDLIKKNVMLRLYDIMKLPNAFSYRMGYSMCAQICELYALCNLKHPEFIHRTLCRDKVWIRCLVELLSVNPQSEQNLNNILQLVEVLAYDDIAYKHINEIFRENPNALLHFCMRSLNVKHINTPLQRSTLKILGLYLAKSQEVKDIYYSAPGDDDLITIVDVIDKKMDRSLLAELPESEPNGCKVYVDFEYDADRVKRLTTFNFRNYLKECYEDFALNVQMESIADFCMIELYRMFMHIYSTNTCKFRNGPIPPQIQTTETISALLKFSSRARITAENLKFLQKVIKILNSFFEQLNLSCSAFIRRYGDKKKVPILTNLSLLIVMIMNWYSAPTAVIVDEKLAEELTLCLYKIWPWISHSVMLKFYVIQLCAFLGEHSIIICKNFASQISSNQNSILQLTMKIVVHDTVSVRSNNREASAAIVVGIRILINSCSCTEGRVSLLKLRVFDIFDAIYPFNLKGQKVREEVLLAWLEFWEIFSRYNEGAAIRHLKSLCAVIMKMPPNSKIRLYCIRVLRNMAFLAPTRSILLSTPEFVAVIDNIYTHPLKEPQEILSLEEQTVASISIWKLISAGAKYIAILRGSKLAKKIKMLNEQLMGMIETDSHRTDNIPYVHDAVGILNIILTILNAQ